VERHDFDPYSLVAGVIFAVIGALFLFDENSLAALQSEWLWPLPALIIGLLLLARALSDRPREERAAGAGPDGAPNDDAGPGAGRDDSDATDERFD
jgi:hypothetical protein